MITDIIFDWGGVLALADNPLAAKILSKKYGYSEEQLMQVIDKAEDRYSQTKNYSGFFKEVQKKFPISVKQIASALNTAHATGVLKLARKLKRRYHVHLLSNQIHLRTRFIRAHNNLSFFDNVFFSSELGMMKPQRRIYRYLLRKIKANPYECLFIDNTKANTDAAKRLGIKTILFKNELQIKKEMERHCIWIE